MKKAKTQPIETKSTARAAHSPMHGIVASRSGAKTIRVKVEMIKMNAKYRKQYLAHKQYAVHDEQGKAAVGDMVSFVECRPLSATKRWRLEAIVKKAV